MKVYFRSEFTGCSLKPGTTEVTVTVWAGSQKCMLRKLSKGCQLRSSTVKKIISSICEIHYFFVSGNDVISAKGQMDG